MAITYNKKALKKTKKVLAKGKHAYAFKSAIFHALFWYGFMILGRLAMYSKLHEKDEFGWIFYSVWGVGALFIFVYNYYSNLKGYKLLKDVYDESVNYFKENDPSYLDDLG